MLYHHYGNDLDDEKISELRVMARERDLQVWRFRKDNTFRIMNTQTNRMVADKLSFEEAWETVVTYPW